MINIFMIYSDKRIDSLIEHFQPFLKSKIRCASDFDNGLKAVFENRPSVIFIQNKIGNLSAEIVSVHIKSLLGSMSPRIVFMGEIESHDKQEQGHWDDWICISDPPKQLQESFAELISRWFPDAWREIHNEINNIDRGLTHGEHKSPSLFNSSSVDPLLLQKDANDSVVIPCGVNESMVMQEPDASDIDIAVGESHMAQNMSPPAISNINDESLSGRLDFPPKKIFFIASFLLLIAVSGYFWMSRRTEIKVPASPPISLNQATGDGPKAPLPKVLPAIQGLPSFVHDEWRDLPYTSLHPGWERYVSPAIEFRIFRVKGKIKALQAISRAMDGISEGLLGKMLEQFELNQPWPDGSETSENGFLVESIMFNGLAELVTYREEGSSAIKAFVLEFS